MRRLAIFVSTASLTLTACGSASSAQRVAPTTTVAPTTVAPTTAASTTTAPPTTTTTTTTAAVPRVSMAGLAGKTILVDPGHNGGNASHASEINQTVDAGNGVTRTCDTTGTAGNDGWPEYAFTMELSNRVAQRLRAAGATVVLTHADTSGWGPCITERAAIGNRADADLGISIHADGNTSGGARGFHVIEPQVASGGTDTVANARRFGGILRDQMRGTGMPTSTYIGSNGISVRGDLGGLNLSTIPKVFIECGNMRNSTDLAMLHDAGWQNQAADAIVAAMAAYFSG